MEPLSFMLTPLEQQEDERLTPYAMRHTANGGRLHPEEPHALRTCYQRDRDRVIHSKAFRRLGYKTQVFANSEGDNYRTRLTHSLEVAQISRSVSASLGLNRDFAETLALVHDVGHTPFGHAGQDTLHTVMKNHGGFEHNCQTLRIVSELETRYLEWNGLNLTRATLKGMMKHERIYSCDTHLEPIAAERSRENLCLEAAIVDQCDRIAYVHHDLEDGLDSDLLDPDELFSLPLWGEHFRYLEKTAGKQFTDARTPLRFRAVLRNMLYASISDLTSTTEKRLAKIRPDSLQDILGLPREDYPVSFSPAMSQALGEIQKFLFARLYRHPRVMGMSRRGQRIIEMLFQEYASNPEIMPDHIQARISAHGLYRVVSDYVSGMTDRYALKEYAYLTGAVPD